MAKLLDWKLDFLNPLVAAKYQSRFNPDMIHNARVINTVVSVFLAAICLIHYFTNDDKHATFMITLYAISSWFAVATMGLYSSFMITHPVFISCTPFFGAAVINISLAIWFGDRYYFYDLESVPAILCVLSLSFMIKMPFKYFPYNLVIFAYHIIFTYVDQPLAPFRLQVGQSMCFAISIVSAWFYSYHYERWIKFAFVRGQIMEMEAKKLEWAVFRDASLLQNIFPKNLSDELEHQINSNREVNIKRKIPSIVKIESANKLSRRVFSAESKVASGTLGADYAPRKRHSIATVPGRRTSLSVNIPNNNQNTRSPPTVSVNSTPKAASATINSPISPTSPDTSSCSTASSPLSTPGTPPVFVIPTVVTPSASLESPRFEDFLPPGAKETKFLLPKAFQKGNQATPKKPKKIRRKRSKLLKIAKATITSFKSYWASWQVDKDLWDGTWWRSNAPVIQPRVPNRYLTTSGQPLHANPQAELHTYLTGALHYDGTLISLSHSYPNVTVVFADLVGFTALSQTIPPEDLVNILNNLFSVFDDIMDDYHLEKIRTLGDGYLYVGNMSIPLEDHEEMALYAAKKMIATVSSMEKFNLKLRVGVSSGPLIAGITGITKWNYDIFGYPFEQATFMETVSAPNAITMTSSVYFALRDRSSFVCKRHFIHRENHEDPVIECYVLTPDLQACPLVTTISQKSMVGIEFIAQSSRPENLSILCADESDGELFAILSEITGPGLTGLAQYDPNKPPPYTRDELEDEESQVIRSTTCIKFKRKTFKVDLESKIDPMIANYTKHGIVVMFLSLFFFMIADLLKYNNSNLVPQALWMTYGVSLSFVFGFWLVARKCDIIDVRPATILVIVYAFTFVALVYICPSQSHATWTIIVLNYLMSFIRVRGPRLVYIQTVACIINSYIALKFTPSLDPLTYFGETIHMMVGSCLAQILYERNFHMDFLTTQITSYDMWHQGRAQQRAKLLLNNILPEDIIPRLKPSATGESVVDLFPEATIMFINITNLAALTSGLNNTKTFQIYNELFTKFDEATQQLGLEKIKTINTVYMVACGVPKKKQNHAELSVQLAIKLHRIATQFSSPSLIGHFKVRVGIATGPVIAGIIGKKKYSYDCWSDTTNTAARMESNGLDGHLQANKSSFDLLANKFEFSKREDVYIKGKGNMETYLLDLAAHT